MAASPNDIGNAETLIKPVGKIYVSLWVVIITHSNYYILSFKLPPPGKDELSMVALDQQYCDY